MLIEDNGITANPICSFIISAIFPQPRLFSIADPADCGSSSGVPSSYSVAKQAKLAPRVM